MREEHEDRLDTAFIEEAAEAAERLLGAGRYFLAALHRPKDAAKILEAAQKNMDEVMAAIVKLDAEIKLSMAGAHEAEMEALLTKAGEIVEAAVEKGDIIQAENGRLYAREHAPEHLRVKQNERKRGLNTAGRHAAFC